VTRRQAALALIVAICGAGRLQGQLTVSSELQGSIYPRQAFGREARQGDFRGSLELEYKHTLREGLSFRSDLIAYGPNLGRAFFDGTAALVWRRGPLEIAGGLLRERWGRFTNSNLDPLGPANTLFSLLRPELRLSQATVRTTVFFRGVSLDFYVLAGGRLQPLPDIDRRFSLGLPSRNIVRRGALADQALGFRASGTTAGVDWAVHTFAGRSRRPTFVPRFTTGQAAGVDAIYTDIRQFGGELEKTVADWRLVTEGFVRNGAVNVSGREQTYGHLAAAAEYQRFGVFGKAYDLIPRAEVTADSRGVQTDLPFASSLRIGARLAQTGLLPFQIEPAYAYDLTLRAHGVIASVEKAVAESPNLRLGFRFAKLSRGRKPSLLDAWKYDVELAAFLRVEVSPR
jgi:hypothetical protein